MNEYDYSAQPGSQLDNTYRPYPYGVLPAPCPTCTSCPTCGRRGFHPHYPFPTITFTAPAAPYTVYF